MAETNLALQTLEYRRAHAIEKIGDVNAQVGDYIVTYPTKFQEVLSAEAFQARFIEPEPSAKPKEKKK